MKSLKNLALVAMTSLVLASCGTTQQVPLTGRTHRISVSDEQVLSLSNQEYTKYMASAKKSKNATQTAMVRRVGQRLATAVETYLKQNGFANDLKNYSWEFNLVQDNSANAFCMPGGKIVVYEGLLPYTQNETCLAIVLGHEIAHAVAKHSAEQLSKQQNQQIGTNIFEQFPSLSDSINSTLHDMNQFNYFLGLNISDTPWAIIKSSIASHAWLLLIIAVLIPVLSYITQVINIKLMPTAATAGGDNDQMARQMKTMNTMMPLMSLFFCFVTPVGLGIYWVASALCRAVQQFFINKHIENLDLEDIIAKNQEKVKKKREKMGVTEERIRQAAAMNTRSIQSKANVSSANIELEREKANAAKANAKPGSMAAKANLVKEFSEKNNRK